MEVRNIISCAVVKVEWKMKRSCNHFYGNWVWLFLLLLFQVYFESKQSLALNMLYCWIISGVYESILFHHKRGFVKYAQWPFHWGRIFCHGHHSSQDSIQTKKLQFYFQFVSEISPLHFILHIFYVTLPWPVLSVWCLYLTWIGMVSPSLTTFTASACPLLRAEG